VAIVGATFTEKKIDMPKTKSAEQGSATTVAAALDPEVDSKFWYQTHECQAMRFRGLCRCVRSILDDCNPTKTLGYGSIPANAEKLWALTEEIVGEKFAY